MENFGVQRIITGITTMKILMFTRQICTIQVSLRYGHMGKNSMHTKNFHLFTSFFYSVPTIPYAYQLLEAR